MDRDPWASGVFERVVLAIILLVMGAFNVTALYLATENAGTLDPQLEWALSMVFYGLAITLLIYIAGGPVLRIGYRRVQEIV